jgi:hypothetical protein
LILFSRYAVAGIDDLDETYDEEGDQVEEEQNGYEEEH